MRERSQSDICPFNTTVMPFRFCRATNWLTVNWCTASIKLNCAKQPFLTVLAVNYCVLARLTEPHPQSEPVWLILVCSSKVSWNTFNGCLKPADSGNVCSRLPGITSVRCRIVSMIQVYVLLQNSIDIVAEDIIRRPVRCEEDRTEVCLRSGILASIQV